MDQGKRLHNVRCEPFLNNEHSVYAINVVLHISCYRGLNNIAH